VSVAVVVPLAGDCPHRKCAWDWLKARYAEHHQDWQVVEARAPEGPWRKGAAVTRAIEACDAEIIVQADADVWSEGLSAAVEAVADGASWALPHLTVHRLTEQGTAAVLAGAPWTVQPLTQKPYKGLEGGGYVVAPREVLLSVPIDPRFVGWGQDDETHAIALYALVGKPWRGDAPLFHLWHPPQERLNRRIGSQESWELRRRYLKCRKDSSALRALIEEARDVTSRTAEHSSDDQPQDRIG
jgi:hypothetical protein